jgi:DNA-binding phage protein
MGYDHLCLETRRDTMKPRVTPKTTRFDAVDYLDTKERRVAYIAAALETGDADFVRDALSLVARVAKPPAAQ